MIIPAAMNIYGGAELLKQMDPAARQSQLRELASAKEQAQQNYRIGNTFEAGYELGMSVARAMLRGNAELMLKGADPEKIL